MAGVVGVECGAPETLGGGVGFPLTLGLGGESYEHRRPDFYTNFVNEPILERSYTIVEDLPGIAHMLKLHHLVNKKLSE